MKQDQVDSFVLMRELLSSIRDLNKRIDELKIFLKSEYLTTEGKEATLKRVEKLIQTRFDLIYSIYDIRREFLSKQSEDSLMKDALNFDKMAKELRIL